MDRRYVAVVFCGGSAFLDMYATQPLLPELQRTFATSEEAVGATISTLTFACALAAPFAGPVADRFGRKRVIVTSIAMLALVTLAAATATSLHALLVWRFVQGLFMPAIFATTLAYIAEELPPDVAGRAVGLYIGGNVLGGFLGRYIAALVAARTRWEDAFLVLGALNAAGAIVVQLALPRARRFARGASLRGAATAMGRFLREPQMLATYVVGACVLFTLVAAFTFATYHLAAPPYRLDTTALGNVFFVYLLGAVATPLAGRLIDRFGHRIALLVAIGGGVAGMLLTLAPAIVAVVAGLAVMSTGVFVAQAASQGYIGTIATQRRSSAAALYLTWYYAGGGFGAVIPAAAWRAGGWTATVGLIVVVQIVTILTAFVGWKRPSADGGAIGGV